MFPFQPLEVTIRIIDDVTLALHNLKHLFSDAVFPFPEILEF
jgi:hypothetical protein